MNPAWGGSGFVDPDAEYLWRLLPAPLQQIAKQELAAGNTPEAIQQDLQTKVVVLTFKRPPYTPQPASVQISVHTRHATGNYCYDGTAWTYELHFPHAFLAFTDPTYDYESETGLKPAA